MLWRAAGLRVEQVAVIAAARIGIFIACGPGLILHERR